MLGLPACVLGCFPASAVLRCLLNRPPSVRRRTEQRKGATRGQLDDEGQAREPTPRHPSTPSRPSPPESATHPQPVPSSRRGIAHDHAMGQIQHGGTARTPKGAERQISPWRAHPVRPGTRTTHGSPVLLGAKAQVKHTSASCEHPSYLRSRPQPELASPGVEPGPQPRRLAIRQTSSSPSMPLADYTESPNGNRTVPTSAAKPSQGAPSQGQMAWHACDLARVHTTSSFFACLTLHLLPHVTLRSLPRPSCLCITVCHGSASRLPEPVSLQHHVDALGQPLWNHGTLPEPLTAQAKGVLEPNVPSLEASWSPSPRRAHNHPTGRSPSATSRAWGSRMSGLFLTGRVAGWAIRSEERSSETLVLAMSVCRVEVSAGLECNKGILYLPALAVDISTRHISHPTPMPIRDTHSHTLHPAISGQAEFGSVLVGELATLCSHSHGWPSLRSHPTHETSA
ncbi:hypothetical protein ACCO45_001751 [Purpureocillium lilacinum]|uniref:Uncharacterized protein n=1 Tax=Purpureocillium lilacinum TaxID=33203 RepID=A0ACC4E803_PURLI